jgi:type I restriction enzyme S subunit
MSAVTKDLNGYGTIPGHWDVAALPDAVFFQEGPGLRKWQWTESGMKVINVTNILGDGRIDTNNTSRFISIEEYEKTYRHFTVDAGDIVVASSGNTYGKIGRISAKDLPLMMNTSVIRFRSCDQMKLDDGFLYAFLRSEVFSNQVESFVIGSAQPNFGPTHLKRMVMPLPPLPIQQRIAGILSAYDELIENSQRRIKILESMARALYREWFVHFRFPGHENHPRVASSLGEIPQGWEVKIVADAFVISGGGTPSRKEDEFWTNGTIQWYSPTDLTRAGTMFIDDSSDHITERGLTQSSARMFPARSVMLTSRATIGAIAINTQSACTNQGFITCLPNDRVPLYYLFHWLTENVPTFQRMASGATFKEISRGVFKTIEFLQPPDDLVTQFEDIAAPMAEQVLALQRQIQNLRRTRDLLLPRLLSGQIEVGAA